MIVFNAWLTCVWISFHDKIGYPPLTPLFLRSWNKTKMKFTEIPNVGITNFWRKIRLWPLEINKIVILNFTCLQWVYFLNFFSAIFVYVYNDNPSLNCSSIISLNREKYQIIKSQCWRFQTRHKLWNSKRQEIP